MMGAIFSLQLHCMGYGSRFHFNELSGTGTLSLEPANGIGDQICDALNNKQFRAEVLLESGAQLFSDMMLFNRQDSYQLKMECAGSVAAQNQCKLQAAHDKAGIFKMRFVLTDTEISQSIGAVAGEQYVSQSCLENPTILYSYAASNFKVIVKLKECTDTNIDIFQTQTTDSDAAMLGLKIFDYRKQDSLSLTRSVTGLLLVDRTQISMDFNCSVSDVDYFECEQVLEALRSNVFQDVTLQLKLRLLPRPSDHVVFSQMYEVDVPTIKSLEYANCHSKVLATVSPESVMLIMLPNVQENCVFAQKYDNVKITLGLVGTDGSQYQYDTTGYNVSENQYVMVFSCVNVAQNEGQCAGNLSTMSEMSQVTGTALFQFMDHDTQTGVYSVTFASDPQCFSSARGNVQVGLFCVEAVPQSKLNSECSLLTVDRVQLHLYIVTRENELVLSLSSYEQFSVEQNSFCFPCEKCTAKNIAALQKKMFTTNIFTFVSIDGQNYQIDSLGFSTTVNTAAAAAGICFSLLACFFVAWGFLLFKK